jgi:hypothetical protein
MTTKTYRDNELDCEIMVEEMNRKEALEYAKDWFETIKTATYSTDMSIYIEYKDGSYYSNIDGDESGNFKKSNIKAIILDDGYEYYIYGDYEMTENLIPEVK